MTYQIPDHYRYARRAAEQLRLTIEDLDDGRGYLFRVSDDGRSALFGAGRLSAYPINSASSYTIAKDKGFTNTILESHGVSNLGGRCFFLNDDHKKLRDSGFEVTDAKKFLEELGFPAFCKPLHGSRGDFAEIVDSSTAFDAYVDRVRCKYDSIIIQRVHSGEEHRVLVLDNEVIFCLRKPPIELIGDGNRKIEELLKELNQGLEGTGVSPFALHSIEQGRPGEVLPSGIRVPLRGRKNFSSSHSPGTLVDPCPAELARTAQRAACALRLRIAGVDLMSDSQDGTIRVIEVNATPGIHSLEALERFDLVDRIWKYILIESLKL